MLGKPNDAHRLVEAGPASVIVNPNNASGKASKKLKQNNKYPFDLFTFKII
jgi:hypothetical protein